MSKLKEKVFHSGRSEESARNSDEFEHGVAEILGKARLDDESTKSKPWEHEDDNEAFGVNEKFIFLKELVKDLYSYGLPAHQVDSFLSQISFAMGIPSVTFRLETNGYWVISDTTTQYIACPKTVNLAKLTKTIELAHKIIQGSAGIEIVERLYHIRHIPNAYPPWIPAVYLPISSAGFTVFFFGGDSVAIIASLACGFTFGLISSFMQAGYGKSFIKVFPFFISLVVGIVSGALAASGATQGGCAFAMALGSTAFFFPGVSLTLSVVEIAYGLHGTGAVRYLYAVISGQLISVGLFIGNVISVQYIYGMKNLNIMISKKCQEGEEFQNRYRILFYFFLFVGSVMVYQQPKNHWFPFLLTQGMTFAVYYFLATDLYINGVALDGGIATFIAVMAMALIAAVITSQRIRHALHAVNLTSMALILPTIELLVPGSSVVRQMYMTLVGNSSEAFSQNYIYTALCIAMGLLAGEALLRSINVSVFDVPEFLGSITNVERSKLNDPRYFKGLMPSTRGQSGALVHLHGAINLPAVDRNGLSDPYVTIQNAASGEKLSKSRVIYHTLSPNWSDGFMLTVPSVDRTSYDFKVKDYSFMAKSEVLGSLTLEFRHEIREDKDPAHGKKKTKSTIFRKSKSLFPDSGLGHHRMSRDSRRSSKASSSAREEANKHEVLPGYDSNVVDEEKGYGKGELGNIYEVDEEKANNESLYPPAQRTLLCDGVVIGRGDADSDIIIDGWFPLRTATGTSLILLSIRWFSQRRIYNDEEEYGENMPEQDKDDEDFVDPDYEHTLAYFTWLQRHAVRGEDGRYIDPPEDVTESPDEPDLENAAEMIDAAQAQESSLNLCEDQQQGRMDESALTLASGDVNENSTSEQEQSATPKGKGERTYSKPHRKSQTSHDMTHASRMDSYRKFEAHQKRCEEREEGKKTGGSRSTRQSTGSSGTQEVSDGQSLSHADSKLTRSPSISKATAKKTLNKLESLGTQRSLGGLNEAPRGGTGFADLVRRVRDKSRAQDNSWATYT